MSEPERFTESRESEGVLTYQPPAPVTWAPILRIVGGIGLIVGVARLVGTGTEAWRIAHQPARGGIWPLIVFLWILTAVILVIGSILIAATRPRGRMMLVINELVYAVSYLLVTTMSFVQRQGMPAFSRNYLLSQIAWTTIAAVGYSAVACLILGQSGAKALFVQPGDSGANPERGS